MNARSDGDSAALMPGGAPVIPEHELLRRIGEGAYGEVWLARNRTGAYRAVKIVYRHRFSDDRPYDREFKGITRFEPVSRSTEGLINVLQVGRDDDAGFFYYVMEPADPETSNDEVRDPKEKENPKSGFSVPSDFAIRHANSYAPRSLSSEVRRRGRLPFEECLQLGLTISLALGRLHRHGLLHRDVKPSNIIFVGGLPKLADIGLVTDAAEARSYVGTEGFIPPDGPNSAQADLYALGKVLYEISMGKDRQEFPEPHTALVDDPDAPALLELNAIILKACAADPRQRYPSAEDMHADLALLHSGRSVKRKHALERRIAWMSKVGPVVTAVAILATTAFLVQRQQNAEIRRLAKAEALQRGRAQSALTLADEHLVRLEYKRAEEALASGHASEGLADLAQLLRQHPTNRIAAQRTVAALSQRNFLLPAMPTLHLSSNVSAVTFSPDGGKLFLAAEDRTLLVCDIRTGQARKLAEVESVLDLLAFNTDPGKFVSLARDHSVSYRDAETGQAVGRPITVATNSRLIDMTADGARLAFLGADKQILVWDLQSNRAVGPAIPAPGELLSISLNPDGTRVLAISSDWKSQIWSVNTGKPQTEPLLCWIRVILPTFSPDGNLVVLGSEQKSGRIRGGESLNAVGQELRHENWINCIDFSPDSQRVVTGSADRTSRVWDAHNGQPVAPAIYHHGLVQLVKFSPEGRRLAIVSSDNTVRLWDARTAEPLSEPVETQAEVSHIRFSPDGDALLIIANGGSVRLVDLRIGRMLPRVLPNEGVVRSAEFNGDETKVLASNESWTGWLWDLGTQPARALPFPHTKPIRSVEFSPDESLLVTCGDDNAARIWQASTGKLVGKPLAHETAVGHARFDPSGKTVVTGCDNGEVRLWDVATTQRVGEPIKHPKGIIKVDFTRDGQKLITTARDATVRIWELHPRPRMLTEIRRDGYTRAIQSPDGRLLSVFSDDLTAQIWDIKSGSPVSPLLRHNTGVWLAAFSPDGKRLMTGCRDGSTRVWDLERFQSIRGPQHEGLIEAGAFSPDGRRIMTGSEDGIARIWDAETGQPLSEILRHGWNVRSGRFSTNGSWLLTASADKLVRIWEAPADFGPAPEWLSELAEAVGGRKLDAQSALTQADDSGFWRARKACQEAPVSDPYQRWAEWYFASREKRPISPGTSMTLSDLVGECLQNNSAEGLKEALRDSPNNALALARLAKKDFEEANTNSLAGAVAAATWLSDYSTRRAPDSAEIWRLRAEFLHETGNAAEAITAWDRSIKLKPEPRLWLMKSIDLEAVGALRAAGEASCNGLSLIGQMQRCPASVLRRLQLQRVNILRREGEHTEALAELTKVTTFPLRDPATPSNCLDLTLCYNASLDESWHNFGDKGNNLSGLSPGLHTFEGTAFDARGIVQLTAAIKELEPVYPDSVQEIRLRRICHRIHFLHGAGWSAPVGTQIAHWIIHSEKEKPEDLPIVYGNDVRNWQFWPGMPPEEGGAAPIWKGTQERWKKWAGAGVRLYKTTWENPHPEVPITSIDFVSARAGSAPFLLAITVE